MLKFISTFTPKKVLSMAKAHLSIWEEAKAKGLLDSDQISEIRRLLKLFGSFTNHKEQSIQSCLYSLVN